MTAGELLDRLEQDPQYIARMAQLEEDRKAAIDEYRVAAAPFVADLHRAGFVFSSAHELRHSSVRYTSAVPVLLKWLPLVTNERVKEDIVRTLTVPWARPVAAVPLIAEFRRAPVDPGGVKWAIGNALAVVADDSVFESIAELFQDKRHGTGRQMLAEALGKMKNPRAANVLMAMLNDPDVAGHAVKALGVLRATEAEPLIEPFCEHEKAWIRKEAKRALERIRKGRAK